MPTAIPKSQEPSINGASTTAGSSAPLKGTTAAPGTQQTTGALAPSMTEKLMKVVNTSHVRFAWFLCNVAVVWNGLMYLQPLVGGAVLTSLWYRATFLGALGTFAIVIYQNLKSYQVAGKWSMRALLQDDNVHYLYDALIWLVFPRQWLATLPFIVFSVFHVLTFVGNEVLPTLGVLPGVASKIASFTVQNHEMSRRLAASSELLLLVVLVFKALLFRKWSWITLIAYGLFMKVKSEGSIFTRNVLKDWEVRLDGLASSEKVPPVAKAQWGNAKRAIKSLDKVSLIKRAEATTAQAQAAQKTQ